MAMVGEAAVVAVVDELKEFLVGPGGEVAGVEVVEDEEGGVAHLLEEDGIGEGGVGLVGGAEVIEEVGHDNVEGRASGGDAVVGDGGGEGGFPVAGVAAEQEPGAFRVFVAGEGAAAVEGGGEDGGGIGAERVEGDAVEGPQVAVTLESILAFGFGLAAGAAAGHGGAEVRVAGQAVRPDESRVVAEGAGRRLELDRPSVTAG